MEDSRLPAEAHGPTPSIGRLLKGASRHLTLRHTQHQQRAGTSQPSLPAKENSSIPAPGPWWCRAIVPPSGVCGKELGICLCPEFMSTYLPGHFKTLPLGASLP